MELLKTHFCDMHPHNTYLEFLSETGLIGLGLFILAMALAVWRFIKETYFSGVAIVPAAFAGAALVVILFPMVTQSIFSNWPAMLFWYTLSVAVCVPRIAKVPA